ncbi:MAG TPA: hypothetical protein PLF40_14515 [Kofleriaceae bacterium]|nr:hypothetical protein [Kofleriaceae bacterium]
MKFAAAALLIGLGAIVACSMSQSCPCGQAYTRDPLNPNATLNISASHDTEEHCWCRCGNGPALRMPPSLTCEGYEGPCEAADKSIAQLTCQ